jgi:hypothetical protein
MAAAGRRQQRSLLANAAARAAQRRCIHTLNMASCLGISERARTRVYLLPPRYMLAIISLGKRLSVTVHISLEVERGG